MNEGASDPDKKKKIVKEDVSAKVPAKQDVAEQGTKKRKGGHIKMIARKRKRPQPDVNSDDEHRKCLKIITFEAILRKHTRRYRVDSLGRLKDYDGILNRKVKDGTVIYMLVERKYPLSKELLQRMLDFGLEVEIESTTALDLIRVLNSPCFMVKSWLVQDQTVLGKDYSNLLIADSLLKTIWFINAPCYGNEALASPKANGVWFNTAYWGNLAWVSRLLYSRIFHDLYFEYGVWLHLDTAYRSSLRGYLSEVRARIRYIFIDGYGYRKALSFRTLFTPGGNGVDVVVLVESIRAISERFAKMMYGFFWGKQVAYPMFISIDGLDAVLKNGSWFICNNQLNLKKWNLDVNLLKEDVGNAPNECPNNINSDVVKNMKKPGQAPRSVSVGPKVGLKLVKQVYRHVSKKNNVNTSGNKKDVDLTIEVSNSNLFDMLNLVENDVSLGTNGGTSNLVTLVDEGKPLAKVDFSGDHDSEDEVASVDNKMTNFLASKKVGYGTNSLLEQWKETYANDGYGFDPYDDGMYEVQDIPDKIQAICDNLDIKV
ncbi:hypothetical protein Tco_0309393 [Tanacetum coccineum]